MSAKIQNLRRYSGRRGSGRCGSAVTSHDPIIRARHGVLGILPGIQGHTDLVRIKQPKSGSGSPGLAAKGSRSASAHEWLPLFDERITDGAHRLLVKNAQSQEAGQSALAHGRRAAIPRLRDMLESGWSSQVAAETKIVVAGFAADHWLDDASHAKLTPRCAAMASVSAVGENQDDVAIR